MSIFDTDLVFMLADAPNSVEVSFGDVETSGILDYEDQIVTDENSQPVQVRITGVRVATSVLENLEEPLVDDDPIAVDGKSFLVRGDPMPQDDGAVSLIQIVELK